MPQRLIGPLAVAVAAAAAFVAALVLAGGSGDGGNRPGNEKASSAPAARPVAFEVDATAPVITGLRAATIPHLKAKRKPKSDTGGGNTSTDQRGTVTDPNTNPNHYDPGTGNNTTNNTNNNGGGNGPTHTTPQDPGE